jgi:hypothetical protein
MDFEGAVTVDDKGRYITVHVVAEPSDAMKAAQAAQAAEAEQEAELAAQVETPPSAQPRSGPAEQGLGVLRS